MIHWQGQLINKIKHIKIMACKIVINAKWRKQSWESKCEMLSTERSMKCSTRWLEKSLLEEEVLSKDWKEARE